MSTRETQEQVADVFARIGRLISNGVPLISSLEVTASELEDQPVLKKILERTCRYLEIGKSFADSLKESPLFPDSLIMAIAAGEQQGILDEQMLSIAESVQKGDFTLDDLPSIESMDETIGGDSDQLMETIPELVEKILENGFRAKVSDVHIDPDKDGSRVRFRIDGILHTQPDGLTMEQHTALASRIKILSSLDPAERKLPQDGRILRQYSQKPGDESTKVEVDLRISSSPFFHGEKIVIRYLYKEGFPESLEKIMTTEKVDILRGWISKPYGLIICTGPTGCGKTTTAYLMLKELASKEGQNVMTVEDPVEILIPGAQQMQINPAIGLNFDSALRAFLRLDPDVVYVGEIREPETAIIITKVALTGHLVLTQLHRPDTISSLNLLKDIGISSYVLKQILIGIVAQRLVRKLCPDCKQKISKDIQKQLPEPYCSLDTTLYDAKGCDKCDQIGYKGRMAVYEIFEPTIEFWKRFEEGEPVKNLQKTFSENSISFRDEANRILSEGLTTWTELARVNV